VSEENEDERLWSGDASEDGAPEVAESEEPTVVGAAHTPAGAEAEGADTPVTEVCRRCSVQTTTSGAFCPSCGASYEKHRTSRRTKIVAGALVAVVILAGGGMAVAMKIQHDDDVAAKERAAKQRAAAAAVALQRKREADAQARVDAAERLVRELKREIRKETVHSMEKSITKDAKSRVDDGRLDGPILGTQCEQAPGDAKKSATPYLCMAITERNDDGTIRGYNFTATANFEDGSYTWHLGN